MHGLGNDFVVIDARADGPRVTPALARAIGDRHRGVGFDQLAEIVDAVGDRIDVRRGCTRTGDVCVCTGVRGQYSGRSPSTSRGLIARTHCSEFTRHANFIARFVERDLVHEVADQRQAPAG